MKITDYVEFINYMKIFGIVFIVSLILNYFNLTLGLNMYDLIKLDIFITLWFSLYFRNKEWFKVISLIMISLISLMILVDFLEKNLYFGLGSPSAFRLILIVGGGTVIIMGSLMYFKWKMGELDF
jgi:hypothetical protein